MYFKQIKKLLIEKNIFFMLNVFKKCLTINQDYV